jgi:hypothetical protein
MGLKGYRLWATGHLDSTCRAPPRGVGRARRGRVVLALDLESPSHRGGEIRAEALGVVRPAVVVQVAFESRGLKPGLLTS